LKVILQLILKDLRRDWKHPWTILLFMSLPLLMTGMIASVFGGGGKTITPTIHLAVMDQDDDFLSRALRSMASQEKTGKQLDLQFVDKREDGIRLIENRKVSALVVLPKNMTTDLLDGKTNVIELYENPAEQVLPKVVRQGALLTATGLSGAGELIGEPLKEIRTLFNLQEFPDETIVGESAMSSTRQLKGLKTYLFPPIITFTNIPAADWNPL